MQFGMGYMEDGKDFVMLLVIQEGVMSILFKLACSYLQILAIPTPPPIQSIMQTDSTNHAETTPDGNKPFRIQLTAKQAHFLAKLLPLRYSLQPDRKKTGPKSTKHPPSSKRRSNLPPTPSPSHPTHPLQLSHASPIRPSTFSQRTLPAQSPLQHPQHSEETTSVPRPPPKALKPHPPATREWRLLFLSECREVPLFVKAYSNVLDLLERRTRAGQITQEDFMQTIINVVNDQKMRRTQKGQELSNQLMKVFMKHRYRAIAARKAKEEKFRTKASKEIPSTSPAKRQQKVVESSPVKEEKGKEKEKEKGKAKRSGSQSSDDIGVDFDLNEFQLAKPSLQFNDNQFMEAAAISQGLRRLPADEASALLKKYAMPVIDVLKIKALSASQLKQLKEDLTILEKRFHQKTSSFSERQSAESSFEVEEE